MGQQMNTILLLLIFTGLVGLLLVVFFMLDRLNELHKHADLQKPPYVPDDTFGGLTGKTLWDAMIGIPMSGWDAKNSNHSSHATRPCCKSIWNYCLKMASSMRARVLRCRCVATAW